MFTYRRRLQQAAAAPDNATTEGRGAADAVAGQVVEADAAAALLAHGAAAAGARQLSEASEELLAWRDRMVFYEGDESQFFDMDAPACPATSALFDPSCRTTRKTHKQVAYSGYGMYRGEAGTGCTLSTRFNAWVCPSSTLTPMRLIIENMDEDHNSRVIVPVALASGGYVQLMNGVWDHDGSCGGYECLRRLMTFWATVATNRSYDIAFTATNPQHLRLILPYGSGETPGAATPGAAAHPSRHLEGSRLLVSIFYSNPERLDVYWKRRRVLPLEHHMIASNQYNFSMTKPTINDPCGSNAFAGWENKLYVVLCGGVPGVEIVTVAKIVLSIGIELPTEDFFDAHYLVRNLASLFGIPASRMRVPKIVAGSTRRRLMDGSSGVAVQVEVEAEELCAEVETCGAHGECAQGECICDDGWETPPGCAEGDCVCSHQVGCPSTCDGCTAGGECVACADAQQFVLDGACVDACPANMAAVATPSGGSSCAPCNETCGGACFGPTGDNCLVCDSVGVHAFLLNGACVLHCPAVGYFADEARVCQPCSSRCATCSGPRSTDCTGCRDNACRSRGRCPEVGQARVYPSLDVHSPANFTMMVGGGRNFVAADTDLVSLICPGGSYAGAGVVAIAESQESTLLGCTISSLEPVAFESGGVIEAVDTSPSAGHCTSNCPHGQYTDVLGQCRKCNLACRRCSGPADTQCVDPTPSSPFTTADCAPGAIRKGKRCVLSCSAGSYLLVPLLGQCAECANYDCETCDAADPTRCLACKPTPWIRRVLKSDGKCHESCESGEYLTSSGICAACDATCDSCDGPGAFACKGCDVGGELPIFHHGQCTATCPAGFASGTESAASCLPCHSTCGSCDAPAEAARCTTCAAATSHFLPRGVSAGSCRTSCLAGEYGSAGRCVACEGGCTRCRAAGACTECAAGLVLRGGKCGESSATATRTAADAIGALFTLANTTRTMAEDAKLDTGYTLTAMRLQTPRVPTAKEAALGLAGVPVYEVQRIVIVANAPPAPGPHSPPSPPLSPPPPPSSSPFSPPGDPSPPPPHTPPPEPPAAPPSPDTPLAGELLLAFNGETTAAGIDLAVVARYALGYDNEGDNNTAAMLFAVALTQLSTTASSANKEPPLSVAVSADLNASSATVTLVVDVAFHAHEFVSSPLNLGSLPLVSLDIDGLAGVQNATVVALQKGAPPPNMTYPEQAVSLRASAATFAGLVGELRLSFDNATTAPFAPNATATAVREALQDLDEIGEVEVFRVELSDTEGAFAGLRWTVRFYDSGYPSHVGPQPPLLPDTSNLSVASAGDGRRSRHLTLAELGIAADAETTVEGVSPYTADTSDEALRATVAVEEVGGNQTDDSSEAVAFVQVLHVCGNGIRSDRRGRATTTTRRAATAAARSASSRRASAAPPPTEVAGGSGIGGLRHVLSHLW